MISSHGLEKLGFNPKNDFVLRDDGDGVIYVSEWKSAQPQPSEVEIGSADAEWQVEYDAQEYARNRKAEYPSIDELVVALWENVVEERAASVVSLESKRQAIKAKYPK